jgi:hypothetical protein
MIKPKLYSHQIKIIALLKILKSIACEMVVN